jgi:hypothetical protein
VRFHLARYKGPPSRNAHRCALQPAEDTTSPDELHAPGVGRVDDVPVFRARLWAFAPSVRVMRSGPEPVDRCHLKKLVPERVAPSSNGLCADEVQDVSGQDLHRPPRNNTRSTWYQASAAARSSSRALQRGWTAQGVVDSDSASDKLRALSLLDRSNDRSNLQPGLRA